MHILILTYMCACVLSRFSHVQLFATPWAIAHQASLPMGFSKQKSWSGLPCLIQGIFPTQGSNPCLSCLLHWQAGSLPLGHLGSPLTYTHTHTHTHTHDVTCSKFPLHSTQKLKLENNYVFSNSIMFLTSEK